MMTRQILLSLAVEMKDEPGSVENGRAFIHEYLQQRGIDSTSLNLVNRTGLSRETRVSARMLADVLLLADSIPFMPEFVSSLSIIGWIEPQKIDYADESNQVIPT